MSIQKSYAVFGLGKYGRAVAAELVKSGADVLAVDCNEALVNSAVVDIPFCRCADVTDSETIARLGIRNMDVVIIAMAESLEASVMAVMLCKEAGVRTIIAKCGSEMHYKILKRVGADQVVFPERESGVRLAKNLLSSGFVDLVELSDDVSLVALDVRAEWVGKTLVELNLRKKYGMNIVAIRRNGHTQIDIDPNAVLTADMGLVVVVSADKLKKLKA